MPFVVSSWLQLTADGPSESIKHTKTVDGATLFAYGGFGGGTLALEGSPDDTNWYPINDSSGSAITLTAPGSAIIPGNHKYLRVSLSGSTTPTVDAGLVLES